MKKLLILMQSCFITSVAINPILSVNSKQDQSSSTMMNVSATDIIDLDFKEGETSGGAVALPNLASFLNRSDIKDKNIQSASITLTTPILPEEISYTWNLGTSDINQLQYALRSDVTITHTEVVIQISLPYINYTEAEYVGNNGPALLSLGTFNWQETGMHLFLTKNVKYQYNIVLS